MLKSKKIILSLVFIFVFLMAACSRQTTSSEDTEGYDIYYMKKDEYKLVSEKHIINETDKNKLISRLIYCMMNPDNKDNQSVINSRVKIQDYSITDNIVYLNFSSEYTSQRDVEELLCRAAFVKTITQIEGIDFLGMSINEQPLLFRNNTVSLMKASDFVDISTNGGMNNSTEVLLYFANETGDKLKTEKVTIEYNNNSTLEKSIVDALIQGPKEEGYYRTLSERVTVIDAFTRNDICYVYFDSKMSNSLVSVKDDVLIYSIVNSLSELTYISKVQIIVDGQIGKKINDTISIDKAFSRNLDIVETSE